MSVRYQDSIDVAAPPERIWAVLSDVESWPRWTPTVDEAELLVGPLGDGAKVRLKQPRLPATVWTVTSWRPLEGFTWASAGAGVRTEAHHELRPDTPGRPVTVELALTQAGALSWLVHLLLGRVSRRYLRAEAEGLRAWCEAPRPPS